MSTGNINIPSTKATFYLYDSKSNRILIRGENVNFSKTRFIIFDIHGREILNYLLSSNSQYIDLPSLPSGIYLDEITPYFNSKY
ncbi:MAG: T9SS type A sorting domain-containing protein [Saprospiraceae bacterium]|uniref:T9SS type A sorting domain-containing protein n=1 Tax=Candidatus Defluviibacterium haderslevense TaxID=2981993 RepID=A0A9D7SC55_9BACT|nr:T9SS type A sorting domain-containing protein [Candidatus Defluviibacterium haderslevense]